MPILSISVARWLAPLRSGGRLEHRTQARSRLGDMAERPARRHVLIVEDEPALRDHYKRFFSSRYDLTFASSGAEALERLAEATPDVAVLDMRLPDTDGVALLREIHETRPELPVIIATAFLSIEPQLQLLDVPYTDYIVKPFRLDELGARIDAAI